MSTKTYSPKEAAIAVLAKAEELYKASSLAKADPQHPGATSLAPGVGAASQAASEAHLKTPEGDAERKQGNAERMASAATPDQPEKGHIKLAKFVGSMQAKRGNRPGAAKPMDKVEIGQEPLAQAAAPSKAAPGIGFTGTPKTEPAMAAPTQTAAAPTKGAHEQTLDQIHQMSKPKLGKGM